MSSEQSKEPKRGRGRPRSFNPDSILKRVQEAFWDTGYSATSLDDLTVATGVNRPSLYSAFGDKQALYLAALEKSRVEAASQLEAALAVDGPLCESLERLFQKVAHLYLQGDTGQRGCFLVGTAAAESVVDREIRHVLFQALDEFDKLFERRFRQAQKTGELVAGVDVVTLAKVATAILNGMSIRARAGGDAETLAQFGQGFVVMVRALSAK